MSIYLLWRCLYLSYTIFLRVDDMLDTLMKKLKQEVNGTGNAILKWKAGDVVIATEPLSANATDKNYEKQRLESLGMKHKSELKLEFSSAV